MEKEPIPLITQEYIDNHPDRPGLVIGQPLPDAPQTFVRELISNKEEIAEGAEPKISSMPVPSLNDTGITEKVSKQRGDRDGVMIYTIRRQGQPDEVLNVAAGSELAFQLDQKINAQDGQSAEVIAEQASEDPDIATFKVIDSVGNFVRAYNEADHGEKAEELANQYATKIGGVVKSFVPEAPAEEIAPTPPEVPPALPHDPGGQPFQPDPSTEVNQS